MKFLLILVLGVATASAAEQIVYPGWLKVPKPELVLHVQHEEIKPSARRDAGEFMLMIMRELIRSGFTIHVSREYLTQEIAYYEKFVNEERYPAMGKAVLTCLKQAQESGAFDWDALRKIAPPDDDPIAIYDYFPWLSPPHNPDRVRVASTNAASLPWLRVQTRWDGIAQKGYAGVAGKGTEGARYREWTGIGQSGERTAWRFAVGLRFSTNDQVRFEKFYLWEPWRNTINYSPLAITTAKVLDDVRRGLDFTWDKPPEKKGKKAKR